MTTKIRGAKRTITRTKPTMNNINNKNNIVSLSNQ